MSLGSSLNLSVPSRGNDGAHVVSRSVVAGWRGGIGKEKDVVLLWGFWPSNPRWQPAAGERDSFLGTRGVARRWARGASRPRGGVWRHRRLGWGYRRLGAQGEVTTGPAASGRSDLAPRVALGTVAGKAMTPHGPGRGELCPRGAWCRQEASGSRHPRVPGSPSSGPGRGHRGGREATMTPGGPAQLDAIRKADSLLFGG